jgi:hypothetical protein
MQAEDFPFEGFQTVGAGLNEEQMFAGFFQLVPPPIDGFHRSDENVDTSCQAFLDDSPRDFASLAKGTAGHQHKTELIGARHGSYSRPIVHEASGLKYFACEQKANTGRGLAVDGSTRHERKVVSVQPQMEQTSKSEIQANRR